MTSTIPQVLSDERAMRVAIHACDSLNITRVHAAGKTRNICDDAGLLEIARAIEREVAEALAAPVGSRVVPVEPTDEMLSCGKREAHRNNGAPDKALRMYRAMLAAAPSTTVAAPVQETLTPLARRVIQQRDTYGWSVECDEAINAMRLSLASPSPVAPVLPAGDAVELAAECKRLADKMMRASWATGTDSAWMPTASALHAAIDSLAALSKQVPAGDASEFKMPDAGHPLLQRLIDSISIESGKACWDYLAMYEVRDELARLSQSGQADSTGGCMSSNTTPAPAAATEYDLFEDVIAKLRFGNLSRSGQHEQLRRVAALSVQPVPDATPALGASLLPHAGSPEASVMIDSVLAEYDWPSNTKNAARAGYVAAKRLLASQGASPAATACSASTLGVPASPSLQPTVSAAIPNVGALLPCQFCGSTHALKITSAQELAEEDPDYDGEFWEHSYSFAVICDASHPNGPGGCGVTGGFDPSERGAEERWNRRGARGMEAPAGGETEGLDPKGDSPVGLPTRPDGSSAEQTAQLPQAEPSDAELRAWRERFPAYVYRPQDDCVSLKLKQQEQTR